jgi:hypothetical protein
MMLTTTRAVAACLSLAVLALLAGPNAAFAKSADARTFAVLPFQVKGPEKYQYLDKGIQSMLASRLTWKGHFEPVDSAEVDRYLKEHDVPAAPSELEAIKIMQELGAEYLFSGKTVVKGDQAKVDLNIQKQDGKHWEKQVDASLTQLIPQLNLKAKEITSELFERPGADKEVEQAKRKQEQKGSGEAPANPAFVYGETGQSTDVDAINPRFKYQSSPDTPGRWRSQGMRFASECSTAGDMDGDGVTEIIIVGDSKIRAYHIEQGRLMSKGELEYSHRFQPLRLSFMDFNKDGVQEIVLSGMENERPFSMILNYDNGSFSMQHDRIRLYLNVLQTPPLYNKVLIGQRKGMAKPFKNDGVREVAIADGDFDLTRKIRLPEYTNLFNFSYLPTKEGDHYILIIGPYGKLRLYSEDLNIIHKSEEAYNGSSLAINVVKRTPGLGKPPEDTRLYDTYYVPMPITVAMLGSNERTQVLVSKDISIAAKFFDSFRYFSQGEIHSLYWDGIGLNLFWKTRRIKGTIICYGLADIDNDGGLDLWVNLNTYPGALGLKYRKTMILGYPLEIAKE